MTPELSFTHLWSIVKLLLTVTNRHVTVERVGLVSSCSGGYDGLDIHIIENTNL